LNSRLPSNDHVAMPCDRPTHRACVPKKISMTIDITEELYHPKVSVELHDLVLVPKPSIGPSYAVDSSAADGAWPWGTEAAKIHAPVC
jgi:hypothetical protein